MLDITFWDVQHGNAIYIKTPTKHIVQDLGIGSYGGGIDFSPLVHLKKKYGVEYLDEVIITHPHTDHIDDIFNFDYLQPKVLNRPTQLTEEEITKANPQTDTDIVQKYLEISNRYSGSLSDDKNPNRAENNGGVKIQFFSSNTINHSNINNHSIVTVITYEERKILLPGDNEDASWSDLLNQPSFKEAISGVDIFLASHHGRDSGFYSQLFTYFKPRLTIISDGPYTETSATDRYGAVTQGWTVHHRNGKDEVRKCVTTRNDGVINIKMGRNTDSNCPFISVTVD
jgi:beta-lactamase superfamily II metal-dependent hydrolase